MVWQKRIESILEKQHQLTSDWHLNSNYIANSDLLTEAILIQHKSNFDLWHLEDDARDAKADDSIIAKIKRGIDKVNQQRNDQIEKIDEKLIQILLESKVTTEQNAKLNSETPGSICDRLSINSLKIFHMKEQVLRTDAPEGHVEKCKMRVELLQEQRNDLTGTLAELFADLQSGFKKLKVYRQVKMYNDPNLNPVLYGNKNSK